MFAQFFDQRRAVARVKDGEVAAQSGGEVFFLQDVQPEAVKGGDVQAARFFAKQRPHPLAHFARRLVGERQRENAVCRIACRAHQPGDFLGDDARLAAARPGDDEQRPTEVADGFGLLWVQGGGDGGHGRDG